LKAPASRRGFSATKAFATTSPADLSSGFAPRDFDQVMKESKVKISTGLSTAAIQPGPDFFIRQRYRHTLANFASWKKPARAVRPAPFVAAAPARARTFQCAFHRAFLWYRLAMTARQSTATASREE
jgi:hypothetical protein